MSSSEIVDRDLICADQRIPLNRITAILEICRERVVFIIHEDLAMGEAVRQEGAKVFECEPANMKYQVDLLHFK